jgi:hypothetical protein
VGTLGIDSADAAMQNRQLAALIAGVVIVVVDCRQSFHSSTGKEEL